MHSQIKDIGLLEDQKEDEESDACDTYEGLEFIQQITQNASKDSKVVVFSSGLPRESELKRVGIGNYFDKAEKKELVEYAETIRTIKKTNEL